MANLLTAVFLPFERKKVVFVQMFFVYGNFIITLPSQIGDGHRLFHHKRK